MADEIGIEEGSDVVVTADGATLHVRGIRPSDAALEQSFVASLSEQTRYFRFFYQLHELTPAMLARFTRIDPAREHALVALDERAGGSSIVAVARYGAAADGQGAEFAIVVADAWQHRGVGRMLMRKLIASARGRGLRHLEGVVLRVNTEMLRFVASLGFELCDAREPEQIKVVLDLAPRPSGSIPLPRGA